MASVSVPPGSVDLGETLHVEYEVQNAGAENAQVGWVDSIYLSRDDRFGPSDILLTRAFHTGGLESGQSYTRTIEVTIPFFDGFVPGEEWYVLVRTDVGHDVPESDNANNAGVSSLFTIEQRVTALPLGEPFAGEIAAGQSQYFQVDYAQGKPLAFRLAGLPTDGTVELFLKRDGLPSRTVFDRVSRSPFATEQYIYLPAQAQAGTFYVLVHAATLASSPANFELTAFVPTFGVLTQQFGTAGSEGDYTLRAIGANFDSTITARLVDGQGFELAAKSHHLDDPTRLYATFDLRGVAPGTYDVVFTNAAEVEVTVPRSLTVIASPAADASAVIPRVIVPSAVRLGAAYSFTVEWENTSQNDAYAPLLTVGNSVPFGLSSTDRDSLGTRYTFLGVNTQGGPAGILRPGQRESITFYGYSNIEAGNYTVFADREIKDLGAAFDWESLRPDLIPAGMSDEEFEPIYDSIVATTGLTSGDYLSLLSRQANLLPEELGDRRNPIDLLALIVADTIASMGTSIRGVVSQNDLSGNLAGQNILALNSEDGTRYASVILMDGSFVFPTVTPGNYRFALDNLLILDSVAVANGQAVTAVVHPTAGATIAGVITHSNEGIGIAGVQVTTTFRFSEQFVTRTTFTDSSGRFSLTGLPEGTYRVLAQPPADAIVTGTVSVAAGAIAQLNLSAQHSGSMAGAVRDAVTGAAIPAALVTAAPQLGSGPSLSIATAEDGSFVLSGLSVGMYSIRVDASGYTAATNDSVIVEAGAATTMNIGLQGVGTIGGAIVVAGLNIPGVGILLLDADGIDVSVVETNSAGEFRFANVAAGTYSVALRVGAHRVVFAQATLSAGQSLDVSAPAFTNAHVVRVGVMSASGAAVGGAEVSAYLDGVGIVHGVADDEGAFAFVVLRPGVLSVVSRAPGEFFPSRTALLDTVSSVQDLDVVGGTLTLRGTVLGPGEAPVAGATIVLQQHDSNESVVTVVYSHAEADGSFEFTGLAEGTYSIVAGSTATGIAYQSVHVSEVTQTVTLHVLGARSLSGMVRDDHNQPVASATVFVVPTAGADKFSAMFSTTDEGEFNIGGLPPGVYQIRVLAEGWPVAEVADVDLTDGDASVSVTLDAPTTTAIHGTVIGDGGGLLAGVQVLAIDAQGKLVGTTSTNDDATFEILSLPAGELTLLAVAYGFEGPPVVVEVTSGQLLSGVTLNAVALGFDISTSEPTVGTVALSPPLAHAAFLLPVDIIAWLEKSRFLLSVREAEPSKPQSPSDDCCTDDHNKAYGIALTDYIRMKGAYDWIGHRFDIYKTSLRVQVGLVTLHIAKAATDTVLAFAPIGKLKAIANASKWFKITRLVDDAASIYQEIQPLITEVQNALSGAIAAPKDFLDKLSKLEDHASNMLTAATHLVTAVDVSMAKLLEMMTNFDFNHVDDYVDELGFIVPWGHPYDSAQVRESLLEQAQQRYKILKTLGDAFGFLDAANSIYKAYKSVREGWAEVVSHYNNLESAVSAYKSSVAKAWASSAALNELGPCPADDDCDRCKGPNPPDDCKDIDRPFSHDPNDIIGPAGYGPDNHIVATSVMPYAIRFENDAEKATAPAAMVTITQTLDADLDWTTFRLGELGFGEVIVDVPADTAFFQTRYDATETLGVFVDIEAGINAATGEIFWQFVAIDPETGDLPENPFVGFLPPNVNGPESEGFVTYTVRPKTTVATGDRVDAIASIVFDVNEAILTPPIFHTFDVGPPASNVLALPALTSAASFQVHWSGEDDAGDSGVARYDVYVSINGGAYAPWIVGSSETGAIYVGEFGRTYRFYSVATDNVGHIEAPPAVADAQTQVVAPPQGDVTADFDGDGDSDGADFLIWQRNIGRSGADVTKANGDADGDQKIDGRDLTIWKNAMGAAPRPWADFDQDDDVDGADFLIWQRNIGVAPAQASIARGDANQDFRIDGVDLAHWQFVFAAQPPWADFDADNDVDGADFLTWQRHLGVSGPEATRSRGNANHDGVIDSRDLAIWEYAFNRVASPGLTTVTAAQADGRAAAHGVWGPTPIEQEPAGTAPRLLARDEVFSLLPGVLQNLQPVHNRHGLLHRPVASRFVEVIAQDRLFHSRPAEWAGERTFDDDQWTLFPWRRIHRGDSATAEESIDEALAIADLLRLAE